MALSFKKRLTGFAAAILLVAGCSSEQMTDLMLASGHGDYPAAVKMIDAGMDVNQATTSGKTPLMYAASEGHDKLVGLLLERGADSDAVDEEGSTALLLAATSGFDEAVKHLLAYNADPSRQSKNGGTPLTNAVFFGRSKTVDLLLGKIINLPKDEGGEMLLLAAGLGHIEIAKSLVAYGIDINSRGKLDRTALITAVAFSNEEMVGALLQLGADPSLQDAEGNTAQTIAEDKGNKPIVSLLAEG